MSRALFLSILLLGVCSLPAPGRADELARIAEILRPMVVEHLPAPLYRKEQEWGRTSPTFSRIRWKGGPKIVKVPKNDGNWRRYTITAREPAQHFTLTLQEIANQQQPEGAVCRASLGMLVGVEMEQELWENGIRLFRRTARARLRAKAEFDCLISIRFEQHPQTSLPEVVIKPKLTNVKVDYDDLVVEHIAGVGGTAAILMGKALIEVVDEVKPSLEEKLLDKAKAAVEKAANKQEIRVSLTKWLGK